MPFPTFLSCALCGGMIACAPATRAAFVPQLNLGLRSSRSQSSALLAAAPLNSGKRWDVTLFARLTWRSRRSPALYPNPFSLSPERWDEVCIDEFRCVWQDPEETSLKTWLEAEP